MTVGAHSKQHEVKGRGRQDTCVDFSSFTWSKSPVSCGHTVQAVLRDVQTVEKGVPSLLVIAFGVPVGHEPLISPVEVDSGPVGSLGIDCTVNRVGDGSAGENDTG